MSVRGGMYDLAYEEVDHGERAADAPAHETLSAIEQMIGRFEKQLAEKDSVITRLTRDLNAAKEELAIIRKAAHNAGKGINTLKLGN